MTIFSVDVETSGLDPIRHDVTSLGIIEMESGLAVACRIDDPTTVWDEDTRGWAEDNIPESVNYLDLLTPDEACELVNEFLDCFPKPYTFMAWPASFDYPFLQKLYSKSHYVFPFHYRTIDIHSLLVGKFGGDIAAGRSDNDLPGIVAEPPAGQIHNPYWDAYYQLKTYKNFIDHV